MTKLNGKVAIVTGAASGIGYAITKRFIAEGAKVVVADIGEDDGKLAKEFGDSVFLVATDVSNEKDVEELVRKSLKQFGTVNILVNNAGVSGPIIRTHELSTEGFKRTIDINLMGQFYTMKNVIPHFLENGNGCIINVGSISGYPPFTAAADYSASKAAVRRLTESAAYEYAADGIRVNSIAPGHIETPIYDGIEEHKTKMAEKVPMKRFGQVEEIASVAVMLASEEISSYITGHTIVVDGGRTLA